MSALHQRSAVLAPRTSLRDFCFLVSPPLKRINKQYATERPKEAHRRAGGIGVEKKDKNADDFFEPLELVRHYNERIKITERACEGKHATSTRRRKPSGSYSPTVVETFAVIDVCTAADRSKVKSPASRLVVTMGLFSPLQRNLGSFLCSAGSGLRVACAVCTVIWRRGFLLLLQFLPSCCSST